MVRAKFKGSISVISFIYHIMLDIISLFYNTQCVDMKNIVKTDFKHVLLFIKLFRTTIRMTSTDMVLNKHKDSKHKNSTKSDNKF